MMWRFARVVQARRVVVLTDVEYRELNAQQEAGLDYDTQVGFCWPMNVRLCVVHLRVAVYRPGWPCLEPRTLAIAAAARTHCVRRGLFCRFFRC